MSNHRFTKVACAIALAGSSALPLLAAVTTDYDHNVNFRSYHTFSFYKVQTADPFYEQRIKDEVTADLTKAGWQMVPSGGDVAITAIGGVHDKQEYDTFYQGLGGGGWGWRGWGGWAGGWAPAETSTMVQTVPVGALLLDMYDTSSHQLIWRGRSSEDLSKNSDKNSKKLDHDIDHMLNGFPPRTKG